MKMIGTIPLILIKDEALLYCCISLLLFCYKLQGHFANSFTMEKRNLSFRSGRITFSRASVDYKTKQCQLKMGDDCFTL